MFFNKFSILILDTINQSYSSMINLTTWPETTKSKSHRKQTPQISFLFFSCVYCIRGVRKTL